MSRKLKTITMKKISLIFGALFIITLIIQSCSNNTNEIESQLNTIDERYKMFMSFDGCLKNITEINKDTANRSAQLKIISSILPETFNFLNNEIVYINSIEVNEKNKEVVNEYKSKIGTLFSEHIKIFRLLFVELSKQKSDYWGKLTLEGSNYDILRQVYDNKTQKSVINMETNNLILMRFKKVIMESTDKTSEELNISSPSDSELTPMKM